MWKQMVLCAALVSSFHSSNALGQDVPVTVPATRPAEAKALAASRVVGVTVYQGTALVTREVEVKGNAGLLELVVSPLPPLTIGTSLFTESSDGIRVLTTRYRTRAVQEDTREEVRAREEQIHQLAQKNQELQKQLEVIALDQQLLAKLEAFTAATMQQLTEKGQLNADSAIKLANYVMERRAAEGTQQIALQHQIEANQKGVSRLKRGTHVGEELHGFIGFEIANGRADKEDELASGQGAQLRQVMRIVGHDGTHAQMPQMPIQADHSIFERGHRDIDRIKTQAQLSARQGFNENPGFAGAACAEFHQGEIVSGLGHDLRSVLFKNGTLRARGIVLGQFGDLLEEA